MPTTQTINAILEAMTPGHEYRPIELINLLRAEGIDEPNAKEAISFLIDGQRVEMTENRRLRALDLVA
jgi:hypothetical protein